MNAHFGRSASAHLFAACLINLLAGGCGDDGDDNSKKSSYAPSSADGKSDGSAGGDLVALQIRQSELTCACAGDAELQELCLELVWPEGQADCMRDALNARAAQNTQAFACAEKAERESIDCLTAAGCDQDALGECRTAFSRAVDACPQFDEQTQTEGQACADISSDDFGDDDWDEDDWCENADICDGFEDCADGSDEENCDN